MAGGIVHDFNNPLTGIFSPDLGLRRHLAHPYKLTDLADTVARVFDRSSDESSDTRRD